MVGFFQIVPLPDKNCRDDRRENRACRRQNSGFTTGGINQAEPLKQEKPGWVAESQRQEAERVFPTNLDALDLGKKKANRPSDHETEREGINRSGKRHGDFHKRE